MRKYLTYAIIGAGVLLLCGCAKTANKSLATDSNAETIIETDSNGVEIVLDAKTRKPVETTDETRFTLPDVVEEEETETTEVGTRPSDEEKEIEAEQGEPVEFRGMVEKINGNVYRLAVRVNGGTVSTEVTANDIKSLDKTLKEGDNFLLTAYYSKPITGEEKELTIEKVESLVSEATEQSSIEAQNLLDNEIESGE